MKTKHTYALEAGRCILRDGKPFVAIVRSESPLERVDPCDADDFARLCSQSPALLRQRDELEKALRFAVAALTQPVQFSGTISEGACAILRGDAAAVVANARATLANCEKDNAADLKISDGPSAQQCSDILGKPGHYQ